MQLTFRFEKSFIDQRTKKVIPDQLLFFTDVHETYGSKTIIGNPVNFQLQKKLKKLPGFYYESDGSWDTYYFLPAYHANTVLSFIKDFSQTYKEQFTISETWFPKFLFDLKNAGYVNPSEVEEYLKIPTAITKEDEKIWGVNFFKKRIHTNEQIKSTSAEELQMRTSVFFNM